MKRGGRLPRRTPLSAKRKPRTSDETRARHLVGLRSGGMCEGCGKRPATDWAHRVGRAQLGPWCPTNGLHLCSNRSTPDGRQGCHEWSHDRRAEAEKLGWILPSTANPATVPVQHARYGLVLLDAVGGWAPAGESAA